MHFDYLKTAVMRRNNMTFQSDASFALVINNILTE
jgi:hypothetical protein